jgi:hypothetical protein
MVITYHGGNYFKISSGQTTILLNPENQRSYKGASLILFTEKELGAEDRDGGETFLIDHPGEFEVQDIRIRGFSAGGDAKKIQTVYHLLFDDISLALVGAITKELPADFSEHLENIDIALVPAHAPLGAAGLAKFLRQIEPGIIVPAGGEKEKTMKEFFKEFGADEATCEEKLVIKKKDISEKEMKVICLKSE